MRNSKIFCRGAGMVLSLAMMLGIFAACGKQEETSKAGNSTEAVSTSTTAATEPGTGKVSDKPVTFTMLYSDNASYPFNAEWPTLKKMTELTNVSLDIQVVPDSDYQTKRQIIFNSGSIPDIVCKTSANDIKDYVPNGTFLPVSDYVDRMPNFKSLIEKIDLKPDLDNIKESDGKFYALPVNTFTKKFQPQTWMVRKDVFDKEGIKIPATTDEMYEAAKALKAKYPDTYPIINRFGTGNIIGNLGRLFVPGAGGWTDNAGWHYDKTSDKWINTTSSEEFKTLLQFSNKLLAEGLLDKEFSTLDSNVYMQRIQAGKAFILIDWDDTIAGYNAEGRKINPDFNMVPIMPPKGPNGLCQLNPTSKMHESWVIPASVKDNENFDTLIKFIDWFYGTEGTDLFSWGIEGKSYTVVNGEKKITDDIMSGKTYAPKEYGVLNNCFTVVKPIEWVMAQKSSDIVGVYQEMVDKEVAGDPDPNLQLTADEREQEKLTRTALKDYIDQMAEKFIYGKESFGNWDSYVQECRKKGSDKLGELYNKVWERQKSQK